jgi:hypothetical protein
VVKTLQNQKLYAHAPPTQGLGNDGHQPLTPAVVLSTIDGTGQSLGGQNYSQ